AVKLAEYTNAKTLFDQGKHPYTRGLMNSIPKITAERQKPEAIIGAPPDLRDLPKGCNFAPRCNHVMHRCLSTDPELKAINDHHSVRCLLYEEAKKAVST